MKFSVTLLFATLGAVSAITTFEDVATKCFTDKVLTHAYHHTYHQVMHMYKHRQIKLLEIGLGCNMGGGRGAASICLWKTYFERADLWMMDFDETCARASQGNLTNKIIVGDQGSEADLLRAIEESGGEFDFIVDDGSHLPPHQLSTFRILFERALKPGGTYIIEDMESNVRPLCSTEFPRGGSANDQVLFWLDQLIKIPRDQPADVPTGLMSITTQREMVVFHKCPSNEARCP